MTFDLIAHLQRQKAFSPWIMPQESV